jgi:hypothetical protein
LQRSLRPSRLITSKTFAKADIKDSINIEIPGEAIVARRGQRLRIGCAPWLRGLCSSAYSLSNPAVARSSISAQTRTRL